MDEPPPFTRKQESLTFAALAWTVASGFADGNDAAVLDAEIALDDAEHRIDQALLNSMSSAPAALS